MGNRSLDDFLDDGETAETDDGPSDDDATAGTDDDRDEGVVDETVADEDGSEGVGAVADRQDGEHGGQDGEECDETSADVSVPTDAVDPATSTYLGRAGECAACGETVQRRWESEEGPVCPECKAW